MIYYGLYDYDLDGFKGGHAGNNLIKLVNESAERIVYLSQCDEEPLTSDVHPIDVLEAYNYGIRIISEEEHDKINESDTLFLSCVVEDISDGICFNWSNEYLEHATNHGLFNRNDYISIQLILDNLHKAYEEYNKMDQITHNQLEKNKCHIIKSIEKSIQSLEKMINIHRKEINKTTYQN